MKNCEVKERLVTFIKYKELSTRAFEESCSLSNGFVANISKSIGAEKLLSILSKYPELNIYWLINGEGEMLQAAESETNVIVDQMLQDRNKERALHDLQINQLLDQNSELIRQNKTLTELLRVYIDGTA